MEVEVNVEGWLPKAYDYDRPRRGQIRRGVIVKCDGEGAIIDVGHKTDGFVPAWDIESLGEEGASLKPGQEVVARVVQPRDREGNLILSLSQARVEKDWDRAEELLKSGELWTGKVTEQNSGGLIVTFGQVRGFIPASHLGQGKRGAPAEGRAEELKAYLGQELLLKLIEVDRQKRRLILSERLAKRQLLEASMSEAMNALSEGQVCHGIVRSLSDFGAFVDIGGVEGLVHVSELAWGKVTHPSQVVQVGDEMDVRILHLDREHQRISLSRKRLLPTPWEAAEQTYYDGQLVKGRVTHVVDFGAFVALESGVEGLIHVSELADPAPHDPREVVKPGDELTVRVLHVDGARRRIALSLARVDAEEALT